MPPLRIYDVATIRNIIICEVRKDLVNNETKGGLHLSGTVTAPPVSYRFFHWRCRSRPMPWIIFPSQRRPLQLPRGVVILHTVMPRQLCSLIWRQIIGKCQREYLYRISTRGRWLPLQLYACPFHGHGYTRCARQSMIVCELLALHACTLHSKYKSQEKMSNNVVWNISIYTEFVP